MELRKEYEAIAQQFASSIYDCTGLGEAHDTVRNAVTACQELADRPPKWLSNEEIAEALAGKGPVKNDPSWIAAGQRVIAAHIAKQREPQVVKFRAARWKGDHTVVAVARDDSKLSEYWEWLEPAQEFEVRT